MSRVRFTFRLGTGSEVSITLSPEDTELWTRLDDELKDSARIDTKDLAETFGWQVSTIVQACGADTTTRSARA